MVALGGENGLKIGTPYVEGASVTGKVLKNGKGKKNHSVHLQTEKRF